jgi:hypothetical protein
MNFFRYKFLNKRVVSQYYHNFLDHIYPKSLETQKLIKNGFCKLNLKFPIEKIDLKKYLNYNNLDFVSDRKKINFNDLKIIYKKLNNIGTFKIIKEYLGKDLLAYDNTILTLGTKKSRDGSWQPHHDSKGRRLKIYIWLNDINYNTHPLFYKKGSHRSIINWKNYSDTRFKNEGDFEKIYGDLGSIIIFDTHGIHSNFKETIEARSVIELTLESKGFLRRVNKKNFKTESLRLGYIKLNELIN